MAALAAQPIDEKSTKQQAVNRIMAEARENLCTVNVTVEDDSLWHGRSRYGFAHAMDVARSEYFTRLCVMRFEAVCVEALAQSKRPKQSARIEKVA